MILFYSPDIVAAGELSESDSAHCVRVMRMRQGDEIDVTDGKGNLYRCVITDAHSKHTSVDIISTCRQELHWRPRITLAVAPTKNIDRMEWLAEKAVEIGVSRLVFLNCRHSVRRVVKRDRMMKVMVAAMKQSLKATLPELVEMTEFSDFIREENCGMKFVGYCDDETERLEFARIYDGLSDITILIGPEGDFSPDEINDAFAAGFRPVTFGNTRLRTETAALFALCAAHTIMLQQG
ncbi:MAG: 16S rRNA (uracil(1498)-N(3))-methyltransferase [Muribaculaceae bacterium]|nr:16S rRNA (uracil(1498)-N(3))-methyltransferase [Muribaculaceae bacterium]